MSYKNIDVMVLALSAYHGVDRKDVDSARRLICCLINLSKHRGVGIKDVCPVYQIPEENPWLRKCVSLATLALSGDLIDETGGAIAFTKVPPAVAKDYEPPVIKHKTEKSPASYKVRYVLGVAIIVWVSILSYYIKS